MADPPGRQTDRQTSGKTTRWQITVYESQWPLMETMPPGIAWWGWQKEICPTTEKAHYQGCMISRQQHRWSGCKGDYKVASTLTQQLPGVHIEPADNWQKLLQYCKKEDTRAPGSSFIAQTNSIPTHFQYAEDLAKRIYTLHEQCGILDDWTNATAMDQINSIARTDIRAGKRYVAWIISNPQWAAMWRPYWKDFILSFSSINGSQVSCSPQGSSSCQEGEDVSLNG